MELNQYGRGDMTKKIVVDFKVLHYKLKVNQRRVIQFVVVLSNYKKSSCTKSCICAIIIIVTFKSTPGRRAPKPIQPPRNSLISDPNPPKALIWHPLAGKNGNPTPYFDPLHIHHVQLHLFHFKIIQTIQTTYQVNCHYHG